MAGLTAPGIQLLLGKFVKVSVSNNTLLGEIKECIKIEIGESRSNGGGEQGWIQDLVKGGPKLFGLIFANSAQQSHVNKVSPYWPGSRAHLRALEALGFFITKYAFSPFWGTFLYYF